MEELLLDRKYVFGNYHVVLKQDPITLGYYGIVLEDGKAILKKKDVQQHQRSRDAFEDAKAYARKLQG